MPRLLTTQSSVACSHGAPALLVTSNARVSADSGPVLLETDVHTVTGCPFTIGTKYSPCVTIQWSAGATQVSIGGTAALTESSVGECKSAEGSTQGVAMVQTTQSKADGR